MPAARRKPMFPLLLEQCEFIEHAKLFCLCPCSSLCLRIPLSTWLFRRLLSTSKLPNQSSLSCHPATGYNMHLVYTSIQAQVIGLVP